MTSMRNSSGVEGDLVIDLLLIIKIFKLIIIVVVYSNFLMAYTQMKLGLPVRISILLKILLSHFDYNHIKPQNLTASQRDIIILKSLFSNFPTKHYMFHFHIKLS